MKQLLQSLSNGETLVATLPNPAVLPGTILIESRRSLVSAGTERMLVEFGKASLIEKARKNPERVKQVLQKARTDGVATTLAAVRSKLAEPIPLGYCNAGVVVAVGKGVTGFAVGDRVASNGSHAELVRVPVHLCAKIPDNVTDDAAAFTVLASIGLQGLRLAAPTLGETFVVSGLGLIGLVTVQLLKANGCRVIGIDPDPRRCALAETFGAQTICLGEGVDPVAHALNVTKGVGVDGVLITASTNSNEPIEQAAKMSRKRGRIVLVGVVGLSLDRALFYEKELTFQVSCSYGPGRYDPEYEAKGRDYPIGFVRWTEQRNFEAILQLISQGELNPLPLVTHRFLLSQAASAYNPVGTSGALGILLEYEPSPSDDPKWDRTVPLTSAPITDTGAREAGKPVAGFLGYGNYASRMLVPAFKAANILLDTVVTTGGPLASISGKTAGFRQASTDITEILENPSINVLAVVTRHSNHAEAVVKGLEAKKAVFVEKPLAIDSKQLDTVRKAYIGEAESGGTPFLMVGFNRRFSPFVHPVRSWLEKRSEPASLILLMNAGAIPADHWTQDPAVGGGRIIGEACHLIDLARYLIGYRIVDVHAVSMGKEGGTIITSDKVHITLTFEDGSTAVVHYLANGSTSFPKERIEVFCGGGTVSIENFIALKSFNAAGVRSRRGWRQDKGQIACAKAFAEAVASGGMSPIPFEELMEVAEVCIEAADQVA